MSKYAYAFQNRRTKQFIYGTDKSNSKGRQMLSDCKARLFEPWEFEDEPRWIEVEMKRKNINPKTYKLVKVKLVVLDESEEA